jgi:hypothetical protein
MVPMCGSPYLASSKGGHIRPIGKVATSVFLTFTFVCFLAASASAQVSVLTQNADTERDAVYSNETQLTPTSTIHKLFTMSVDDPVMGQALILGGVNVSGFPTNIAFVTTSPNHSAGATSAWAFNADTGAKLWQLSLGTNASFNTAAPVLDPTLGPHGALFVVTKNKSSNVNQLHAIDALAGTELPGSPMTISATAGGDSFDSAQENARAALLDINGTVYTSFCHMTDSGTYHGWLIGYKYTTGSGFSQNGVWCDTCSGGNQGGIWQGGDGVIYDGTHIYVATGNGSMGGGNFGMSIVQLSPSDLGTVESSYLPPDAAGHSNSDQDLNGGGMVLMPGTGGKIFIGPTKYGAMYLVNDADLGAAAIDTYSANSTVGHSPIAWNSGSAQYAYVWPSGSTIQQFCYSGGSTGSGACEQSTFSAGGTLAISSTPTGANAILWAYGGNELHAMNPANVSAPDYWNSNQTSADSTGTGPGGFQFISIANGKVYIPSGNSLIAYGSPAVVNCTTAPSVPANLSATAESSSQINLSWTASTAGSGCTVTYNMNQSTTSGFTPSSSNQIASGVTGTSYSATGLAASTTYYYVVEAVDSAGSSAASSQASATTGMVSSGTCGVICIDSGATTGISPWVADEDFTGGSTIDHANTINTSNVTNPAPAAVYQTARVGATQASGVGAPFTYTIPGFTAASIRAGRITPKPRSVGLVGCSVVARFIESAAAHKQSKRSAVALGQKHAILAVNVAGNIHRPTHGWSLLDISIRAQYANACQRSPRPIFALQEQAVVIGALCAVTRSQLRLVQAGTYRDHTDHAADGARSIEVACPSAHQFNALHCQFRLLQPVNCSGKRVAQRHIVFSQQCAAGRRRAQGAQAHSLRGGVSHHRAQPTEEFKAGQLPQLSIQSYGCHSVECVLSKQACRNGAVE